MRCAVSKMLHGWSRERSVEVAFLLFLCWVGGWDRRREEFQLSTVNIFVVVAGVQVVKLCREWVGEGWMRVSVRAPAFGKVKRCESWRTHARRVCPSLSSTLEKNYRDRDTKSIDRPDVNHWSAPAWHGVFEPRLTPFLEIYPTILPTPHTFVQPRLTASL
jgi:hypothetical protein